MTDFAETRRQRCRECQTKLPSPTANDHHAFCCKGCHAVFYRQRCAVCETGRVRRRLCHRLKCRSAYRRNRPEFAFPGIDSGSVKERARNADGMGIKSATDARPWRVIAGPELGKRSLHSAALPLDVRYAVYLDRLNVEPLKRHFAELGRKAIFQRHTPPLNVLGGYKFSGAPKVDLRPVSAHADIQRSDCRSAQPIPDDLSIPEFLQRHVAPNERAAA